MKRIIIAVILTLALTTFTLQAMGQKAFTGAGIIESTIGGFMFPDGTVQLSAVQPPCTAITYLPYDINAGGVYCFTGNLETSASTGNAISINVDNVVIDLNGWVLDGLGAGVSTQTNGIYAFQRSNITIRNGVIRGFFRAINIADVDPYDASTGNLIEGIHASESTAWGIYVAGSNNIVRGNQISNTGGSPIATGADGIEVGGPGARVLNNDVGDTIAFGEAAYGIHVRHSNASIVEGNRVHFTSGYDTYPGHGIDMVDSTNVLVRGNSITSADVGIHYAPGGQDISVSTGKYMNNLTDDVTTPFSGGTSVGVND